MVSELAYTELGIKGLATVRL